MFRLPFLFLFCIVAVHTAEWDVNFNNYDGSCNSCKSEEHVQPRVLRLGVFFADPAQATQAIIQNGWTPEATGSEWFRLVDEVIRPELPTGVSFRYFAAIDFNNDCFTDSETASKVPDGQFPFKVGAGLGQRVDACFGTGYPQRKLILSALEVEEDPRQVGVLTLANLVSQVPTDLSGVSIGYPLTGYVDGATELDLWDKTIFANTWPKATIVPFPGENGQTDCFTALLGGQVVGCAARFDPRIVPTLLDGFKFVNNQCRAGENTEACFPAEQEALIAELPVPQAQDLDVHLFAVDDEVLSIIKNAWIKAMENGRYRVWCGQYAQRLYCPTCARTVEAIAEFCLDQCMQMTGKACA